MPFDFSNTRLATRNNGSPRKLPPMPLAIWSFLDGTVVSPGVSQRLPVVETSGSHEVVVYGALIRVQELIDGERIVVEYPPAGHIAFERRDSHVKRVVINETLAVAIQ